MGMAASQARFLGLTARKNNVEYEGQQINQQRTSLANQTANYYNDLLGMKVPTPPSVDNFTKTVYSFNDGALTNQVTSIIAQPNGMFSVSYLSSYVDDFSPVMGVSNIVVSVGDDIEGEKLYDEFVRGTAGGCYTTLIDRTTDSNSVFTILSKTQHIAHVINHMLPIGTYTTTNGDSLSIGTSTSSDIYNKYWTTPNPPAGGDRVIMDKIANIIDGTNLEQKLVDLLYNTRMLATGPTADLTLTNLDALRTQLEELVNTDLKAVLSATYSVGNDNLRLAGVLVDATFNADGTVNNYFGEDPYLKSLSSEQLDGLLANEKMMIEMLDAKYGSQTWMVRYVQNTTTGEYEPQFYSKNQLKQAEYDENSFSLSTINYYYMGQSQKTEEIKNVPAKFEQDSTGRYINITLNPASANEVTYSLTTSTITDQAAYDDAMNQYEFDKNKYEQQIQEINAKIEIIQAQDKNLELRLKQLDTEQDAISQEMEAVSSVVQKNVESTFKTFG